MLRVHQALLHCRCSPPTKQLRFSLCSSKPNPRSRGKPIKTPPLSTPSPLPAMASKRTIADVLMGPARAAAEKKAKSASQPQDASLPQPKNPNAQEKQDGNDATPKKPAAAAVVPPKAETDEKTVALDLRKKGNDFNPRAVASWNDGEPVPFLFLARALDLISNESGRIAIADILTNVFRTVIATTPGDLVATVYLSANKIAPPHEGLELGIGDATIIKALAEAYGRKEAHVKNQLKVCPGCLHCFCCRYSVPF